MSRIHNTDILTTTKTLLLEGKYGVSRVWVYIRAADPDPVFLADPDPNLKTLYDSYF
jgi:hypothetical protein